MIKNSGYVLASLGFHLFVLWNIASLSHRSVVPPEKLSVKITPVEISPTPIVPPPAPPPRKTVSKKLPKKPKHRVATERRVPHANPQAKPVQGLNKDSFVKDGKSTFQAPVGNTLLTSDAGIRKSEVGALQADLSQRAHRVSLVKPEYTEQALQAGLEGQFVADVYVDETGHVGEVALQKKVGYGMDAKLEAAAKSARYEPRKDSLGRSIGGWDRIVFQLVLP